MDEVKLTKTVQKGGCAAKVAASELRVLLSKVKFPSRTKDVLVDGATFDDAAVLNWTGGEDYSLVQTLDFFTPIVDSPLTFGKIAAANALSDVYAMGGVPVSAMAILAYPLSVLPMDVVAKVIQGACDVLEEAKTPLVGGHSIDDDTLKFGLSVSGKVKKNNIWSNAGAKPGDKIILTKPLGTGSATAGLKREVWTEEQMSEVINSMMTLNNVLDYLKPKDIDQVHAATDITGFGLAGHALQMAKASRVSLKIEFSSLPIFEISRVALKEGYLTKAHRTNADYTASDIDWEVTPPTDGLEKIIYDPQTSGGLFLAVAPEAATSILDSIRSKFNHAQVIGTVLENQNFKISFV